MANAPDTGGPPTGSRMVPQTALPPLWARIAAFTAILLGGAAGGLIGASFGRLGNFGPLATGVITLACGLGFAGGVAVVAVLTLRALGEWNTIRERR